MIKTIVAIIFSALALWVVIFLLQFAWLKNFEFFAPRFKNVERQVFENTQSYVEWKRQELNKYMFEYSTTKDEDVKSSIRTMLIHSFSNFDKTKLDYSQQIFLQQLNLN